MSERKPDIDLRTNTTQPLHSDLTPSDTERKEFRARVAQVGSRGIMASRINVDLPAELHGEWVDRMDIGRIHEYELMGFKIDTEHAAQNKLHSDGTGAPIIGDTIFMTIPRWKKEELDRDLLIRQQRNNPSRNAENVELRNTLDISGIPSLKGVESSTEVIEGVDEINRRLQTTE